MVDHFDAQVTCEEYYCEFYPVWDDMIDSANKQLQELSDREYIDV